MTATRPARARLLGVLAALALVLLSVPVGSGPAAAHAALTGSDPADGATLDAEPATVTLTFNEAVRTPAFVVVDAPDGTRLTRGEAEVVDGTVTQRVSAAGQGGRFRIAYRVVSADGHPISGTLRYSVDPPATTAPTEAATDAPTTDAPTGAAEETPSPASAAADPSGGSFWSRHGQHVLWGAGGVVAAGALLLWPWRRARD